MKNMKITIEVVGIWSQIYLTPYLKVTHDKFLNGNYELIIGWLKWELVISV